MVPQQANQTQSTPASVQFPNIPRPASTQPQVVNQPQRVVPNMGTNIVNNNQINGILNQAMPQSSNQ